MRQGRTAKTLEEVEAETKRSIRTFDDLERRGPGPTYLTRPDVEQSDVYMARRSREGSDQVFIERPLFREVPVRGGESTRRKHVGTDTFTMEENEFLFALERGDYLFYE